ncbi:acyl-CoA dehydrogenase family protein [Piscinibacter sakaiensis]|uniref:acyl-CoA dehydrogenase family protein n=1 Tax=Piscinibacter sakaiensis TaxID=1547922 RepID=UPI003AAD66A1
MSELAQPLAAAAERLFGQRCTAELVNSAESGDWPESLWQAVEDLAPASLLVPEAQGGAGGDWVDACLLLERAGEFNVPLPIAESVLAGWLLGRAGLEAGSGPPGFACVETDLEPALQTGRLSLLLHRVPWAAQSTTLVVHARCGKDAVVLRLPRASFEVQAGRAFSGEPRDEVTVRDLGLDTPGVACRVLADASDIDGHGAAALLRAAQIAGACRRVLALTLAFTSERVQFGRSIGQFQAVQHQLAQLAEEAAASRVAVQAAGASCGGPWATAAIAAAKVRAGEAAGLSARISHQLHGAMGTTFEHGLHQSTRRLLTWRDEHGGEAWWARELVAAFRRQGAAGAWTGLTAATSR